MSTFKESLTAFSGRGGITTCSEIGVVQIYFKIARAACKYKHAEECECMMSIIFRMGINSQAKKFAIQYNFARHQNCKI